VAGDAEQLAQHDSDHLRAIRHLDPGEPFDRQHVRQVVHHAAEVIDAIGVGDEGVPRLTLAHLFRAAVVKADVGHHIHDLLAIELEDEPQHAMRTGVLRSDIEKHELAVLALARQPPVLGLEVHRLLLGILLLVR